MICHAARVLEVHGEALLAPIGVQEEPVGGGRAQSLCLEPALGPLGVVAPAGQRVLDVNHLRAEVREDAGAERANRCKREVEDTQARKQVSHRGPSLESVYGCRALSREACALLRIMAKHRWETQPASRPTAARGERWDRCTALPMTIEDIFEAVTRTDAYLGVA